MASKQTIKTKAPKLLLKVLADDLSDDDIISLFNILYSEITISVKLARNIVALQDWTKRLIIERGIPTESKEE